MTCEDCGSECYRTTVFQNVSGAPSKLLVQPGYECHHCGAMYDANGVRLVDPPEEEETEEKEQ